MNIFRLDDDPTMAAWMAMDKHVTKMPTESCQILHTSLRQFGINQAWLYKPFNPKHPSCVWAQESRANFDWLIVHGRALCIEYTRRYGKIHACQSRFDICSAFRHVLPDVPATPQKLAMPDQYRSADLVRSYKLFYAGAKFRFATWKNPAKVPHWWEECRAYVIQNHLEIDPKALTSKKKPLPSVNGK
jgi:hypothetical protein